MKILALNCGSSSVKYQLYDWDAKKVLLKGGVERIGLGGSFVTLEQSSGKTKIERQLDNHTQALSCIMFLLTDDKYGVIDDVKDIAAVAHRVVHGGEEFTCSVLIDDRVEAAIENLFNLAPLHNPPNLAGIRAARGLMPHTPQVAIFDTAFHQTMPDLAFHYAIPLEWYTKHRIRRYGFHGTSHLYVSKRAAVMLGKKPEECNLITMHVGNGVSVTAIKNGVSIDTSMGFTPLEGAIMGTRCGDIDPSIPYYMETVGGLTSTQIYEALNVSSGLVGITGRYMDRRDIIAMAQEGDDLCALAIRMEGYRLKQYIGRYLATLGRVDAVVYTAGVGENSPLIRANSLSEMEPLGIELDIEKNNATFSSSGETDISLPESKIKIFMIPTNEELVLIEDVKGVLDGEYTDHMHFPYSFCK